MPNQKFTEEYHFTNIEELLDALAPWKKEVKLDGYIFRGHAQEDWELVPSALRDPDAFWSQIPIAHGKPIGRQWQWESWQIKAEYQLLREFYRLADKQGIPVPSSKRIRLNMAMEWDHSGAVNMFAKEQWLPEDLAEVAALAQHYGIPTRLLDWSFDIYVALYFALSGAKGFEGNIKIWCLNSQFLSYLKPTVNKTNIEFITPHYADNSNIQGQQGLFTHWPSLSDPINEHITTVNQGDVRRVIRTPLDQLLSQQLGQKHNDTNVFKTFTLPTSEAEKGLKLLTEMGYGPARIFPGLQGVVDQVLEK
jgi:hypothetical protein